MPVAEERRPSVANEARAWTELVQLMADPVYYGAGVPRGDGRLVLVLPGLFGNDWYLQPLHLWLNRIGYQAVPSTFWINAGCPERLTREAEQALERRLKSAVGPVAVIGHSRGGLLAKAIATRLQQRASHLILLGSPVGAIVRYHWVSTGDAPSGASRRLAEASSRVRSLLDPRCNAPDCGCPFPADLQGALHPETKVVSIYSSDDPIVPSWACQVEHGENVQVTGTHTGLAFNRAVYSALASALGD